jgi:hypothetical protein
MRKTVPQRLVEYLLETTVPGATRRQIHIYNHGRTPEGELPITEELTNLRIIYESRSERQGSRIAYWTENAGNALSFIAGFGLSGAACFFLLHDLASDGIIKDLPYWKLHYLTVCAGVVGATIFYIEGGEKSKKLGRWVESQVKKCKQQ